jgi:futalosine hydrolase
MLKNILITSATIQELEPFLKWLKKNSVLCSKEKNYFCFEVNKTNIHIKICGVGMVSTAYELGKLSHEKFDYSINVGIAGAFDKSIKIGEVVVVKEEIFSELGAEDGKRFLKISDLNLGNEKIAPSKLFVPKKILSHLKKVRGITVNTVHGDIHSIKKVVERFHPQIESMEGGAFYFACHHNKWKCLQIRAISNYVEKRDKTKWNIPLAIQELNKTLIDLIKYLCNIH